MPIFLKTNNHNAFLNYIDDFIYVGLPSNIDQSYQFFLSLLADLGLQISKSKLVPPSTEVICLGILINTVAKTISIPRKSYWKLRHYVKIGKVNISVQKKNESQSLLGSLLYITKCIVLHATSSTECCIS